MEAARGWGGHNVVYRLETASGTWAVKALHRELDGALGERLAIELAAFHGGVPMPRPVPALDGGPTVGLGTSLVRCHEWVDGQAKVNEETTAAEARRMGEIVARQHGLRLPWAASLDAPEPADGTTWAELAEGGRRRGAPWAAVLADHLGEVERLADAAAAVRRAAPQQPRVASHRDLNAHNVLFTERGLHLIDWDAAGPISPAFERSYFAVLWARRPDGRYDVDVAAAFLAGYRAEGGEATDDDPDALADAVDGLESWVRKNVRWALTTPSEQQDHLAGLLVGALLAAPATVERQRSVLREAIARDR